MKNKTIISVTSILLFVSCSVKKEPVDYSDGTLINEWNAKLTEAIIGDLFSPPVASRIYAYSHLAAYEALKFADTNHTGITDRLKEFDAIPSPSADKEINFTIAALKAFIEIGSKLVYTDTILANYESSFLDSMRKAGAGAEVMENSIAYGKQVAGVIFKRAASDMFKQTRGMTRYTLLQTAGAWLPTPPDYLPGVEPHWRLIHPFVLDTCSQFRPDPEIAFSTDKKSKFYEAAVEVYEVSKSLDNEKIEITQYWDDNPNVSSHFGHLTIMNQKMTPGGHWMAIVADVVKNRKLSQAEATKAYAMTAVAMADGFIACWEAKYVHSTIRPVTFINQYMDATWQPYLQTPPFPEYPSGHSTVSAAAAMVLTKMFGDSYSFTDSSVVAFGLPVRSFKSFYEASDEAAMSRLYGGIHFRFANEAGKVLGRKTAALLLELMK